MPRWALGFRHFQAPEVRALWRSLRLGLEEIPLPGDLLASYQALPTMALAVGLGLLGRGLLPVWERHVGLLEGRLREWDASGFFPEEALWVSACLSYRFTSPEALEVPLSFRVRLAVERALGWVLLPERSFRERFDAYVLRAVPRLASTPEVGERFRLLKAFYDLG